MNEFLRRHGRWFIASSLLLSILAHDVLAQVRQPVRVEIEMDDEDEAFSVIPAGRRGLMLYREVKNTETRMDRKWQVYHLDTALRIQWENHYYVHLRYFNIGWEYCGDYFYMLFQQNIESVKADWYVLRIDLRTQASETFLIERDFPLEPTEFEVVGNTLIFGGYANYRPTVVAYTFGINQPKVLPGFYNEKNKLLQIDVEDENRKFNVLTSFKIPRGKQSISFKSFDTAGTLTQNVNLMPAEDRSLLDGASVAIGSGFHIIAGTYTKKRSQLSRGLYLAKIAPFDEHIINYYNYGDLKNFFSYMKAKREKRVKKRIKRRKVKGKKVKFTYRLLVHDIIERDDSYIMVGEAFYPKYSHSPFYVPYYSPRTFFNDYGRMFEGYQYTHAVVIGFDTSGRLLWDNSFEINDVVSFNLEQYVHVSTSGDKTVLLYLYDNVIRSKIIEGTEVLEGKAFNDLKLTFEDDVIDNDDSEYEGLDAWYDGNLIAYGVHTIRNQKDEGVRLNREVFFINKIAY